jgi:hypothetical protein
MFVHAVYFWLKPETTPAQKAQFLELSQAMEKIPGVRHLWIGKPADTNRPVIDRSYSYSLVVVFDDAAAEDVYQKHPIHDAFREKCGSFWNKVQIYDSL